MSYQDFRHVTFGGQDYEGDDHLNMYTPESIVHLLKEEGFGEVAIVARGTTPTVFVRRWSSSLTSRRPRQVRATGLRERPGTVLLTKQ